MRLTLSTLSLSLSLYFKVDTFQNTIQGLKTTKNAREKESTVGISFTYVYIIQDFMSCSYHSLCLVLNHYKNVVINKVSIYHQYHHDIP